MISVATGQRLHARLNPAELREHEIRPGLAQGPVPASLTRGYEPPVAVVYLPDPEPEPPPRNGSRAGHPKLPPAPEGKPLGDVEVRRTAVLAALAGGVWRTAWEIAAATGLHPEVVRAILRCSCAASRPVEKAEIKAKGAFIEYAAPGTPGGSPAAGRRRPPHWTRALCASCGDIQPFREEAAGKGTAIVCHCGATIATMFGDEVSPKRRNPPARHKGERMGDETQPTHPQEPAEPPAEPTPPADPQG